MATITATSVSGSGAVVTTLTTLGASDTFTYKSGKTQILTLTNNSGGALTVNIDGDGATTAPLQGVGNVDISGGYSTASIANGAAVVIKLDTISKYLAGTIAVTGGTGIVATLLEY